MKIDPVAVLIIVLTVGYWWHQRGFDAAVGTAIGISLFVLWFRLWERRPRIANLISLVVILPFVFLLIVGLLRHWGWF